MNQPGIRMRNGIATFVGLAILFSFLPAAAAQARLTITYSLPSPTVTLHEPVFLNFQARNISPQPVTLALGKNEVENFLVSFNGPSSARGQSLRVRRGGFGSAGDITLQPGAVYEQQLLLNRWIAFQTPGKYSIQVRLDSSSAPGISTHLDEPFSGIVTVLPRDPRRLASACEVLAQQVEKSSSYEQAASATLSLTYIHDSIVVPYIERSICANPLITPTAIDGLEKIRDDQAIRALISLLDDKRYPDGPVLARAALQRIQEETPDPAVRDMIGGALAAPGRD